jgi:hypothetical protein
MHGRTMRHKAKGRSLSRDIALPVRFFEDLVRLPDHKIVIPELLGTHEQARLSLTFPLSHSLQEVPRCQSRVSSPNLSMAIVCSLLLEDCSSVESDITRWLTGKYGLEQIRCCGNGAHIVEMPSTGWTLGEMG